MSNVSVEYLVLRDNVEYSRLTAFKGGGAAISVTADAAVKWALSGKFAQNRAVNYLTDVIQPVLTIDGVRRPLGKYIPTDAYTEHDGMRPVVSLTAYDLTYLAMSSKIETRLHLAKGYAVHGSHPGTAGRIRHHGFFRGGKHRHAAGGPGGLGAGHRPSHDHQRPGGGDQLQQHLDGRRRHSTLQCVPHAVRGCDIRDVPGWRVFHPIP